MNMVGSTETGDTDAPLPIDVSVGSDCCTEAEDVLTVAYGVLITVEMLQAAAGAGKLPDNFTEEKVEHFADAADVVHKLVTHDQYDAFKADGLGALPSALEGEVRDRLAPLASAYGVEMATDTRDSGTSPLDKVAAAIEAAHGQRGS